MKNSTQTNKNPKAEAKPSRYGAWKKGIATRRAKAKAARTRKANAKHQAYLQRQAKLQAQLDAKAKTIESKAQVKAAKMRRDAETSGSWKGRYARHKMKAIEKSKADIQAIKDKPILDKQERLMEMNTKAQTKQAKVKYAGYATVASALGGSYFSAEDRKNQVKLKELEQSEKYLESLNKKTDSIPDVDGESSVSGLVTGVR